MNDRTLGDPGSWLDVRKMMNQAAPEKSDVMVDNGIPQDKLVDEAELSYECFAIGVWHLEQDNLAEAQHWLGKAIARGIVEAEPLLRTCEHSLTPAGSDTVGAQHRADGAGHKGGATPDVREPKAPALNVVPNPSITRVLVILAGHARLPSGMAEAAEMILGPQSRLKVCELRQNDSPEEFGSRLLALAGDAPGVLVLVDLHGGSPFNAARALASAPGPNPRFELVTGLNLPMLLEVLLRATDDVTELAEVARHSGRDGVMDLMEFIH